MTSNEINGRMFLETPRLIITALDETHYEAYRSQQKDPYLTEFFGGPRDEERIREIFNLLLNQQEQYGFSVGPVYLKETGELIGRAGLVNLDFKPVLDVELACFLLRPHTGKGYPRELCEALIKYAFQTLKAPKVYATVDPKNVAACRVEKLGMILEKEDVYETLGKTVRFYVKYNPNEVRK